MIRINLLGQTRPKTARRPVDTGAALPACSSEPESCWAAWCWVTFIFRAEPIDRRQQPDQAVAGAKDRAAEHQAASGIVSTSKAGSAGAVDTIEKLQRDRTGGQELLDMVANTVSRTENLWLTNMIRKGNNLSIVGSSASINAVANFITAMKRSGYFQKVEIDEAKQGRQQECSDLYIQDERLRLARLRRKQSR